jgi:hypothetical protein
VAFADGNACDYRMLHVDKTVLVSCQAAAPHLEVVWQLCPAGIARVHGDEHLQHTASAHNQNFTMETCSAAASCYWFSCTQAQTIQQHDENGVHLQLANISYSCGRCFQQ